MTPTELAAAYTALRERADKHSQWGECPDNRCREACGTCQNIVRDLADLPPLPVPQDVPAVGMCKCGHDGDRDHDRDEGCGICECRHFVPAEAKP
jgi:hypothetical protein